MAQNVTLYGVADIGYGWTKTTNAAGVNTANTAGLVSGTMSGSRFGIRGTEDMGGGLKAGFQYEAGFSTTDGAFGANGASGVGFGRVAQANIEGSFGRVGIGRNLLPSFIVASSFDVTGTSTNQSTTGLFPGGVRNNGLWYSNSFGAVSLNAFLSTGKSGSNAAPNKLTGTDISVTYTAGPLSAAVALVNGKSETAAITAVAPVPGNAGVAAAAATKGKTSGHVLGASYDLGMVKLFANMTNQKVSDQIASTTTKSAETNLGVQVPLGAVTLMAGFGRDTATSAAGVKTKAQDHVLGASYALTKRTNVFAFTSKDATPAAGTKPKSSYSTVGLRHTF